MWLDLSFEDFLQHYVHMLQWMDVDHTHFIVCDFRGVDTLVMEWLKNKSADTTVYHVGKAPRYVPVKHKTKVSMWTLVGGFNSDQERDDAAIEACTHFLAHDINSGDKYTSSTLRNIERCLELGKVRLGLDD